jgi:glucose/arabinose dehydrogenase
MRIVPSLVVLTAITATGASLVAAGACSSSSSGGAGGAGGTDGGAAAHDGGHDAPHDVTYDAIVVPPPDGSIMNPCSLPGSVQFTASGTVTVPGGGTSWPDLTFLHLPVGFCAHYYGTVGNARQLRFAPGGELFVASPTTGTTGGGGGGLSAIAILPDDNLDGVADNPTIPTIYLDNLPSTQGLLFAPGYFYYQDHTMIMRVPYATGQRSPSGPSTMVANITYSSDPLHWPKPLDMADDGSIFIGNGGSQSDPCVQNTNPSPPPAVTHPFLGGIRKLDPTGAKLDGIPIAQGFRNPIAVRCSKGHNQCFALELALDYSYNQGGREKLVPIRPNQSPIDDWGFPCCASKNLPYAPPQSPSGTDCSGVAQDSNAFLIGDTPFGFDFEQGYWPGQYNRAAYVALHGAAGNWWGARIVSVPTDPSTGLPMPSGDLNDGGNKDGPNVGMTNFATGWDDGTLQHGRPAAVTFAPDGRMFVANDTNGTIIWIASM